MPIVVPVAITPATLPLPDPADRATFSARKLEQLRWANNEYATGSKALADASYANALNAQGDATGAAASAVAASASAASAAAAAGVVQWVSGTTYAQGFTVWSPITFLTYRRKVAGAGTTDPSADLTNWQVLLAGLTRVTVSGTTATAVSGNDYFLTNVALTAVTAPAAVDGAWFAVTPANGLKTNTIAFGAAVVRGPSATATGTFPINLGARMEFIYSAAVSQWVLI